MATETDWRRSWKPDLRASPWKPIEIDETMYLIKTRFYSDSYEMMITDLTLTWYESLSSAAVQKRIKKLNPSFEAPVTKIVSHIETNLDDRSKDTVLTALFKTADAGGHENILIKMDSKLAGMPFAWHFIGKPADKDMFPEHLTIPLLTMIGELTRRQQELVRIISTKDREIEDYRSQGVRASRKHLETGKFDDTSFDAEMSTSKGLEEQVKAVGLLSMNAHNQNLYRQLMTKYAWLTRTSHAGGMEPDDSISLGSSLSPYNASSPSGPSWANRLPPSFTSLNKSPSPKKSPTKSPGSVAPIVSKSPRGEKRVTPDTSPIKDSELIRREALEKKLADEDVRKEVKAKKKKKIGF